MKEEMREEIAEDMLEELEDAQEDQAQEALQNQQEDTLEYQEAYGAPESEEKHNQHEFLNKAAFVSDNTIKTTFLSEQELGRPLFPLRFLLDLLNVSKFYIDPIAKEAGLNPEKENKIAEYFWNKIQNITDSGMSNEGFAMNLNVTRKMDTTRKRIKSAQSLKNLKGGEKYEGR